MIKRILIAVAVVSFFSPVCDASTIVFDNLNGTATTNATPNDRSVMLGGETVDDVTLATTTVVTGINWSGVYGPFITPDDDFVAASEDNFEIRIYADNAGTPGGLLQTFAVGNAVNRTAGIIRPFLGADTQSFNYSADINFTFDANTTHWLSVLNNTTTDVDDFYQSVLSEDQDGNPIDGNAFGRLNVEGAGFTSQGFELDLTILNDPRGD